MKKILVAASLMLAMAVSASAQFQFHAGVTAGYSLTKDRITAKGFNAFAETGFGHGFYVGPTFEFNFGEHFALEADVLFTRESGAIKVNPEKFMTGLNAAVKGIADKVYDINDVPEDQRDYSDPYEPPFSDAQIEDIKGQYVKGRLSTYGLRIPVVAKYKYGRLGVFAGVYADCHLFSQVNIDANIEQGGAVVRYTEKSEEIKQFSTMGYYMLGGEKAPEGGITQDNLKTPAQMFDKAIASRFSMGAIAGVEINFTDNIGMSVAYYHDILSNLQKQYNKAAKLYGSGLNVGLNYRF